MMTKDKRLKMENLIYNVFQALDPTGVNTTKYKNMFSPMSDNEFDKFFKDLFANDDMYLILDTVDYERDLTMDNIEKAANVLKVPLFEKVFMPHVNMNKDEPPVTKFEVPVGYAHLKRLQQILSKKNTTSTNVNIRSAITGQVSGKDKSVRDSDQENFALTTIGAIDALREFMGPRADDLVMMNEMNSDIARKGYTTLSSMTNKVENKTTLNTVDVMLIGMGIKSDLITDGLVVKKTLDN